LDDFDRLFSDFARYDQLIDAIVTSRVVRVEGARTLVHQVQHTRGISTREVLLWMQRTPVDAGWRFTWTTASQEPLDLPRGHVRAPRNDGAWEARPHPEGGLEVVHDIAYDPGGSVPGWVVRAAQTGGLAGVMGDVRAKLTP
jgi:hypothetical protein